MFKTACLRHFFELRQSFKYTFSSPLLLLSSDSLNGLLSYNYTPYGKKRIITWNLVLVIGRAWKKRSKNARRRRKRNRRKPRKWLRRLMSATCELIEQITWGPTFKNQQNARYLIRFSFGGPLPGDHIPRTYPKQYSFRIGRQLKHVTWKVLQLWLSFDGIVPAVTNRTS